MQIPNLRELRELHGLTQKELADVSGVSLRSVAGYEGGAHARPNTARKLAQALNVDVADLVGSDAYPKASASSQPSFNGLLEEERKWRSQLELLESCVQYKVGRAEFYERELERGRFSDYATARGSENLAILAREEFAGFTAWVIDGPVRPLAIALEQVPSNVDPRIAEEFEAKVDVMIYRAKQTTDLLFNHAYELAETAELRKQLIQKRQQAEEDEKRAARGEMRSA